MRFIRKFRRFLINVFGFSKTETNGFLILLVVVILVAIVPRVFFRFHEPKFETDESLAAWVKGIEQSIEVKKKEEEKKRESKVSVKFSSFDPNVDSAEKLMKAGIPEILANRMVNYRSKGGNFRSREDVKKIYGFPDDLFEKVKSYIVLSDVKNDEEPFTAYTEEHFEEIYTFDLNTATLEDLQEVRGIGAVLSKRIVRYRELLGGYQDIVQLNEVYGLKADVILEVSKHATIESEHKKIPINSVDSIKHLAGHPYIDYNLARAILNYRAVHGQFQDLSQLQNIKVLDDSLYHKIAPYLSL